MAVRYISCKLKLPWLCLDIDLSNLWLVLSSCAWWLFLLGWWWRTGAWNNRIFSSNYLPPRWEGGSRSCPNEEQVTPFLCYFLWNPCFLSLFAGLSALLHQSGSYLRWLPEKLPPSGKWQHHSETRLIKPLGNDEALLLCLTPCITLAMVHPAGEEPVASAHWDSARCDTITPRALQSSKLQSRENYCYSSQDSSMCRCSCINYCPECVNLGWLLCYSIDMDTHAVKNILYCLISYFAFL